MIKSRRFWIGLAVSALFLSLFVYFFYKDPGKIADAFKNANYIYIIPAIALYFIAVVFRTIRWRYLLTPLGTFSVGRLFPVVVVGYMANNLLPARLGELVRAYYMGEREQVSASATLATIVLERIFDGLALLLFVAVAIVFLPTIGVSGLGSAEDVSWVLEPAWAAVLTAVFVLAIVGLTIVAGYPRTGELTAKWVARFMPEKTRPRIKGVIGMFFEGLVALRSPRRQLSVLVLSLPVWLFEGGMYLMMGLSFGLTDILPWPAFILSVMFLVTATANLALSLPSSPGGVGPFELLAAASLRLVEVDDSIAFSYALALHVVLLVPVTLLGLFYWWRWSISLARLTRRRGEEAQTAMREGGDRP